MNNYQYKIHKILNNNVIISEDEKRKEIIITGTGIGFKNSVGGYIDSTKIYKVYTLKNNASRQKFETLLNEIPFDCIQLTDHIIEIAKVDLNREFNQSLLITLADHINFAVQQLNKGESSASLVNEEVKRFYQDEYFVGVKAVELINDYYKINLKNSEASAIAFHLINSEYANKLDDTTKILKSIEDILRIIEDTFGIHLEEESLDYSRLIIHLKFFIKRVYLGKKIDDKQYEDILINTKANISKNISKCLNKISDYIKNLYHYEISENERFFLFIHIVRILQTNKK